MGSGCLFYRRSTLEVCVSELIVSVLYVRPRLCPYENILIFKGQVFLTSCVPSQRQNTWDVSPSSRFLFVSFFVVDTTFGFVSVSPCWVCLCLFIYVSRKSWPSNLGLVACCAVCHSCFHWHSDWAAVPLHVFQLDINSNHPVWNLKGSVHVHTPWECRE